MNQLSLNYLHTNIVIPSFILFNYEDFKNVISPIPENMEIFIKEETFGKAKEKLNRNKNLELSNINLTGTALSTYYVIFVEFSNDYVIYDQDNYGVAIAIKDDDFRYFVYSKGTLENTNEKDYFVSEWEVNLEKQTIEGKKDYGPTKYYGMNDFAYTIKKVLEKDANT